jgi:D-2-hydroxyacid dehydrogenase (NADP+)
MSAGNSLLIFHPQGDEIGRALAEDVPDATVIVATTHERAIAHAPSAAAIFALDQDVTTELISAASHLKWIQALTSGTDSLNRMPSIRDDIVITSVHGTHGPQVSELAMLFMLALARRFPAMLDNQRAHRWDHWRQVPLFESTVAIVGMGAIGRVLAQRCKAFDMVVLGVDADATASPHVDQMFSADRLYEALREADFVVLLVPHLPATHHLIDEPALASMRKTAFLINVSRGPVVHESALRDALQRGIIAGAGLDVFAEEPLSPGNAMWDAPNVIITPHVGGDSTTYIRQMRPILAHNARAFTQRRYADLRNLIVRLR